MDDQGHKASRSVAILALGATLAIGLVIAVIDLASDTLSPISIDGFDPRPAMLCTSLVVLATSTYLVWPSRWNIWGHTQVAFAIAAYVIPIFAVHQLNSLNQTVLDKYYPIVLVGTAAAVLGTVLGGMAASDGRAHKIRSRANFLAVGVQKSINRRALIVGGISAVGVAGCFIVMGFVPALAPNPLLAKFFRGPYEAAYAPIALPYRVFTAGITLLLPLTTVLALRRRTSFNYRLILVCTITLLALALTRQVAVSGVLLALGIWFAVRKKPIRYYLSLLIGVYFLGAIAYTLLDTLGLHSFVAVPGTAQSFWEKIAAGAPDVSDQIRFVTGYLEVPYPANGGTFWGGLLPSHYKYNPAIYSLQVANPGQDPTQLQSGGLRLPVPLWGWANFGWPGVLGVSFVSGALSGYLAGLFKRLTPSDSVLVSTYWMVLYVGLVQVIPVFYRSAYLFVIELVVTMFILLWPHPTRSSELGPALLKSESYQGA